MTVGRRILNSFLFSLLVRVAIITWAAATVTFVVMHVTPGTYADILTSELSQFGITEEKRAQIIATYGFDLPLWQQYLNYVGNVFRGDLGTSYVQNQPVASIIAGQLLPTLELAAASIGLALVLAVLVAVVTVQSGSFGRALSSCCEVIAVSLPSFWLGLLLVTTFSFGLGWFPASGAGGFSRLILPAITMGVPVAGIFVQILRPELEKEITAPYFITARARGRRFIGAVVRHALVHAILPIMTLSASYFAVLISGAVIVENLFARPGIGRILLNAVLVKDVPLVAGIVVLSAVAFVVINQCVDRLIVWIDPRIERP